MPLEDRDIFAAICERYPDQPMEYIMAEYEKARILNRQIEQRDAQDAQLRLQAAAMPMAVTIAEAVTTETEEVPEKKSPPRRRYRVRPEKAITDDVIYCCVCGEPRQSLTAKHLAKHGMTVQEYKDFCKYPQNQPLMSHKRLELSRQVVAKAQEKRLAKKQQAMAEQPQETEG